MKIIIYSLALFSIIFCISCSSSSDSSTTETGKGRVGGILQLQSEKFDSVALSLGYLNYITELNNINVNLVRDGKNILSVTSNDGKFDFIYIPNGTYQVQAEICSDITAYSDSFTISDKDSIASKIVLIEKYSSNPDMIDILWAYPNPFTDTVTVNILPGKDMEVSFDCYALDGRHLSNTEHYSISRDNNEPLGFNLSNLTAGIYFLLFKGENTTAYIPIVKQ
jgi:hypothetical protein